MELLGPEAALRRQTLMYLDLGAWGWICKIFGSNYFRVRPFVSFLWLLNLRTGYGQLREGNEGPCPVSDAR
jgi:hypothetical protein